MSNGGWKLNATAVIAVAATGLWGCFVAASCLVYPELLERLNFRFYDWKTSLKGPAPIASEIMHVDIDDEAVQIHGPWPWDRRMSGLIVERLHALGAKAVAFDILYTTAGKSEEGNRAFAEALEKTGIGVTATALGVTYDQEEKIVVESESERTDALYAKAWSVKPASEGPPRLPKVSLLRNTFVPLTPIVNGSAEVGHIKGMSDSDGVYRRVAIAVRLEDRALPSLALATLRVFWNSPKRALEFDPSGNLVIESPTGKIVVPLDAKGRMLLPWQKPWAEFNHYSVQDVLDDRPDPARASRYKDKIVLVAVTGTGSTDVGMTPLGAGVPLSRTHSSAMAAILKGDFFRSVPACPYPVLCGILLSLVITASSGIFSLKVAMALGFCGMLGVVAGSALIFVLWGIEVPIAECLAILIPASACVWYVKAVVTERRAERAAAACERYLSPGIVAEIVQKGRKLDLSTKRRELTVLFVDIQGFSHVAEIVEVEYINLFLNDFFDGMSEAVFMHKGTIDKFLGDGMLAFFGEPVPLENHALAAVETALEMRRQMARLNQTWAKAGIPELKDGLRIRIGLNTGLVIVGNVGSRRRLEYTVLGSAVNIASRLQALAPPDGVIMTARTRSFIRDVIPCEGPALVRVKGIDREIEVYTIGPGVSVGRSDVRV
jgi:adenylate cyclase